MTCFFSFTTSVKQYTFYVLRCGDVHPRQQGCISPDWRTYIPGMEDIKRRRPYTGSHTFRKRKHTVSHTCVFHSQTNVNQRIKKTGALKRDLTLILRHLSIVNQSSLFRRIGKRSCQEVVELSHRSYFALLIGGMRTYQCGTEGNHVQTRHKSLSLRELRRIVPDKLPSWHGG